MLFWNFWNCEMSLCSVKFVLLRKNLKAQGACTIFRTTPILPQLIRSVLEFWECGFVKYCFVLRNLYCLKILESPRQFKNSEFMFKFACLYTLCVCVSSSLNL